MKLIENKIKISFPYRYICLMFPNVDNYWYPFFFAVFAEPYLIFSNKHDIRVYEVPSDPEYDLRRTKPRTTIVIKVS